MQPLHVDPPACPRARPLARPPAHSPTGPLARPPDRPPSRTSVWSPSGNHMHSVRERERDLYRRSGPRAQAYKTKHLNLLISLYEINASSLYMTCLGATAEGQGAPRPPSNAQAILGNCLEIVYLGCSRKPDPKQRNFFFRDIRLCDTEDMSAVRYSRHVCCVTP